MITDLATLKQGLKARQRLLGLDVGTKTIGLALSDFTRTVATPMETIRRTKFAKDADYMIGLLDEHEIGGLIIGLPLNMDGSEGPKCQSVRQFAANLGEKTDVLMAFWDERLSTVAVTRTLLEADTSRAKRAKVVDKMAAAYILQGALDAV
jgi:putative pre-16S rRNA nuclease